MMAVIPAVLVETVGLSIALVSIATLGYTGSVADVLSLPAGFFPKNVVDSIWGLASMGSGFGGMIFSLVTGWVVDHYSYVSAFFGIGLIPMISATVVCSLPGHAAVSADLATVRHTACECGESDGRNEVKN